MNNNQREDILKPWEYDKLLACAIKGRKEMEGLFSFGNYPATQEKSTFGQQSKRFEMMVNYHSCAIIKWTGPR